MPRFSDMMEGGVYNLSMMPTGRGARRRGRQMRLSPEAMIAETRRGRMAGGPSPRVIRNGELPRDNLLFNKFIGRLARQAGVLRQTGEAPPNPSPAGRWTMRYNVGRFPFMQPERTNFDLQRQRPGRKPMVGDDYGLFAR